MAFTDLSSIEEIFASLVQFCPDDTLRVVLSPDERAERKRASVKANKGYYATTARLRYAQRRDDPEFKAANREDSRAWRERLKLEPEKYAAYLESARKRAAAREDKAKSDPALRAELLKKNREAQARHRAKRRVQGYRPTTKAG